MLEDYYSFLQADRTAKYEHLHGSGTPLRPMVTYRLPRAKRTKTAVMVTKAEDLGRLNTPILTVRKGYVALADNTSY